MVESLPQLLRPCLAALHVLGVSLWSVLPVLNSGVLLHWPHSLRQATQPASASVLYLTNGQNNNTCILYRKVVVRIKGIKRCEVITSSLTQLAL